MINLGNDALAREILEKSLDKSKEDGETALVLTHLGAIYRKLGQDYNKAAKYLERAISIYNKISPNSPRKALALGYLGVVYREQSNLQEAKTLLEKAVNHSVLAVQSD